MPPSSTIFYQLYLVHIKHHPKQNMCEHVNYFINCSNMINVCYPKEVDFLPIPTITVKLELLLNSVLLILKHKIFFI